jgi:hypothetical protein
MDGLNNRMDGLDAAVLTLQNKYGLQFSDVGFADLQVMLTSEHVSIRIWQQRAVNTLFGALAATDTLEGVPSNEKQDKYDWKNLPESDGTPGAINHINKMLNKRKKLGKVSKWHKHRHRLLNRGSKFITHNATKKIRTLRCGHGHVTATGYTDVEACPIEEHQHDKVTPNCNTVFELKLPTSIVWRSRDLYFRNVAAQPVCQCLALPTWNGQRLVIYTDLQDRYHAYLMVDDNTTTGRVVDVLPNLTQAQMYAIVEGVLLEKREFIDAIKAVNVSDTRPPTYNEPEVHSPSVAELSRGDDQIAEHKEQTPPPSPGKSYQAPGPTSNGTYTGQLPNPAASTNLKPNTRSSRSGSTSNTSGRSGWTVSGMVTACMRSVRTLFRPACMTADVGSISVPVASHAPVPAAGVLLSVVDPLMVVRPPASIVALPEGSAGDHLHRDNDCVGDNVPVSAELPPSTDIDCVLDVVIAEDASGKVTDDEDAPTGTVASNADHLVAVSDGANMTADGANMTAEFADPLMLAVVVGGAQPSSPARISVELIPLSTSTAASALNPAEPLSLSIKGVGHSSMVSHVETCISSEEAGM